MLSYFSDSPRYDKAKQSKVVIEAQAEASMSIKKQNNVHMYNYRAVLIIHVRQISVTGCNQTAYPDWTKICLVKTKVHRVKLYGPWATLLAFLSYRQTAYTTIMQ